jgi:hypothetical protein
VLEADAGGSRYFADTDQVVVRGRRLETCRYEGGLPALSVDFLELRPVMRFYYRGRSETPVQFTESEAGTGWRYRVEQRPGTCRFRVRVRMAGQEVSSPGLRMLTHDGLLPSVPRVSIRENKAGGDNIDYMTMFLGVAFVYGSVARQVESFAAADCQDMVIFGLNRTGERLSYDEHIHVVRRDRMTFDGYIDQQGRTFDLRGRRTSVPIRRGDIIRYADFTHYAAVYRDRSEDDRPNGRLDLGDELIHTLGEPAILRFGQVFTFTEPRWRIQVFRF